MESSHYCWKQRACQDWSPSPERGGIHYFDTEHVPTGPVMDKPFTHLRNKTHRVISILARAVSTAPGGPGSAKSLISLIREQSSESGYKFSSRHFFGNSEGLWLMASFKRGADCWHELRVVPVFLKEPSGTRSLRENYSDVAEVHKWLERSSSLVTGWPIYNYPKCLFI